MDTHELATNAEQNYWPLHLGVTTDAEKIAYLAERLREMADVETHNDQLSDQVTTLEETNDMLQHEIDDLKAKLEKVHELSQ